MYNPGSLRGKRGKEEIYILSSSLVGDVVMALKHLREAFGFIRGLSWYRCLYRLAYLVFSE